MNFIESFVLGAFKKAGTDYYISKTALNILLSRQSYELLALIAFGNHEKFISVQELPDEVKSELSIGEPQQEIKQILYKRYRQSPEMDAQISSDMEWELTHCVNDHRKYLYDFMSYGLSEHDAKIKAQSLCLMRTIKRYMEKHGNVALVYQVFKKLEIKGEIDCSSAEGFYKYTTWLIRRGIFEGLLLGK